MANDGHHRIQKMKAYLIGESTGGMTAVEIYDNNDQIVWSNEYFERGVTAKGYIDGLKQVIDDMIGCADVEQYDGGLYDDDGNPIAIDSSDTTGWIVGYDAQDKTWWLNDNYRHFGQSTEIADALMGAGLVPADIEHDDHKGSIVKELLNHLKQCTSITSR